MEKKQNKNPKRCVYIMKRGKARISHKKGEDKKDRETRSAEKRGARKDNTEEIFSSYARVH